LDHNKHWMNQRLDQEDKDKRIDRGPNGPVAVSSSFSLSSLHSQAGPAQPPPSTSRTLAEACPFPFSSFPPFFLFRGPGTTSRLLNPSLLSLEQHELVTWARFPPQPFFFFHFMPQGQETEKQSRRAEPRSRLFIFLIATLSFSRHSFHHYSLSSRRRFQAFKRGWRGILGELQMEGRIELEGGD